MPAGLQGCLWHRKRNLWHPTHPMHPKGTSLEPEYGIKEWMWDDVGNHPPGHRRAPLGGAPQTPISFRWAQRVLAPVGHGIRAPNLFWTENEPIPRHDLSGTASPDCRPRQTPSQPPLAGRFSACYGSPRQVVSGIPLLLRDVNPPDRSGGEANPSQAVSHTAETPPPPGLSLIHI